MKRHNDLVLLPWVGGVQDMTVNLSDENWTTNAIDATVDLVKVLDVVGVHVDFEYILDQDSFLRGSIRSERWGTESDYGSGVLSFHRRLRKHLPKSFISSVILPPLELTVPWKRKTPIGEIKELVKVVDQLVFLFYDTGLSKESDFRSSCIELMDLLQDLRSISEDVQFLVAIGGFQNRRELHKYRSMKIENIPSSLKVIRESLDQSDADLIDGIALFCDWQMDSTEWTEFANHWP